MRSYHMRKDDSGIVIRTVSAIVFLTFTFLWLYFFQSDVLAVAQHVLSSGQTHYDRLVGALLITLVLWFLQIGVSAVVRLRNRMHALTYVPSMLLLGAIGYVPAQGQHGAWWWFVLLMLLWCGVVWMVRGYLRFESGMRRRIVRSLWGNMLVLAVMMAVVGAMSNTDAVFHYRAHMESCLLDNRIDDALRTGNRSLETDASLTMLRAYALSKKGQLGESLFSYPVAGRGVDLVPLGSSQTLRYPQDSIYRHLGAIPRQSMDTRSYLTALERSGKATAAVGDYVLCGQLIDRNLDAFAHTITRYYEVADSLPLPRHYREALTLYTHLRSNPVVVSHHPVTEEDYADLQELERQYADFNERKVKVLEKYFGSYWYYYDYMK